MHRKQELNVKTLVYCTDETETYKICLFESQVLFCKRTESVGVRIKTISQKGVASLP